MAMTDRNRRNIEEVSVIMFMMDRYRRDERKSVRHNVHDGQKSMGREKKYPSSGS